MATLRMFDMFEEESYQRPKLLTIRDRQVIRNILLDVTGTELSLSVNDQINDYLKHKDVELQYINTIQNDEKYLKVNIYLGEWKGCDSLTKRTMYEFKQRHPSNPLPENHDQPR